MNLPSYSTAVVDVKKEDWSEGARDSYVRFLPTHHYHRFHDHHDQYHRLVMRKQICTASTIKSAPKHFAIASAKPAQSYIKLILHTRNNINSEQLQISVLSDYSDLNDLAYIQTYLTTQNTKYKSDGYHWLKHCSILNSQEVLETRKKTRSLMRDENMIMP